MKKYFTHNGEKEEGPFSIEELENQNLKATTPIWYEGLDEWTTVENINELKKLLTQKSPPPLVNKEDTKYTEPIDKQSIENKKSNTSWKKMIIGIIIACGVIFSGFLLYNLTLNNESQKQSSESNSSTGLNSNAYPIEEKTYEEKIISVEDTERSEPTTFLSTDGNFRISPLSNRIKIKGTITNSATVVSYKDVVLRVTYLTKTNTSLGSETYVIYESFSPTSVKDFKLKVKKKKNTASVQVNVIDAVPN